MAFLSKEKKFKIIIPQTNCQLGPGEYISPTPQRLIRQNKAPFGTSMKRMITVTQNSPGPGAYYQEKSKQKINELLTRNNFFKQVSNERKKSMNLDSIQFNSTLLSQNKTINEKVKKLKNNLEVAGFSVQEKRFKDDLNKNELLGPGYYFSETKAHTEKQKKKKQKSKITTLNLENYKIKVSTNSTNTTTEKKSTISTIPSKDKQYGYEILDDGYIQPRDNPDMYKTFSGDKWDMVGPGDYNIDLPEDWHRTGTEWSKYRTWRIEPKRDKSKEVKEKIMHSLTTSQEKDNKSNKFDKNKFKQKSLIHKYNISSEPLPLYIKNKGFMNQKWKLTKNYPGPGYYYEEKYWSSFNYQKSPKRYKNDFDPKEKRFNYLEKNINQISPGSYFRDDLKRIKKLKQKYSIEVLNSKKSQNIEKEIPFNSTSERFKPLKKSKSLTQPIPKSENRKNKIIDKNWIRKTFNGKLDKFGFFCPRFENKAFNIFNIIPLNADFPGPGTYINPYTCTGTSNTVEYKGRLLPIQKAKQYSSKPAEQSRNLMPHLENPPVGLYNPGTVHSVNYIVQKKISKTNPVPFESSSPKNTILLKKDEVGPGSYFKEESIKEKTQIKPPFHTQSQRINNVNNLSSVGPGQYELVPTYNWRKKEFNILYL